MIRFLLLLLLPGAELYHSNTDEVESFTRTTLGAQLNTTVTTRTTIHRSSSSTSREPANKAAMPHLLPAKDGKIIPRPISPVKVQPVQGGEKIINSTHNHPKTTPYNAHWHPTKMPVTMKSQQIGESVLKRPNIRKAPTPPNKVKSATKSTMRNPSARYQSPHHLHHKNVSASSRTGHLHHPNITTGVPTSTKPHNPATPPLRNPLRDGQKGLPSAADKVKQIQRGIHSVAQLSRQLKQRRNSTLVNTVINPNSSTFANNLLHVSQTSLDSVFTRGKETMLRELHSLTGPGQVSGLENLTIVPEMDRHHGVGRSGLLRGVYVPGVPESLAQELNSKIHVGIPERNIVYNQTQPSWRDAVSSSELSELVQDGVRFQPESTSPVILIGSTQMASTERTYDNPGLLETAAMARSQVTTTLRTGMTTESNTENHDPSQMGLATDRQYPPDQTHLHRHRHLAVRQHKQGGTNLGSLHNGTSQATVERSHTKYLHNSTQQSTPKHKHTHVMQVSQEQILLVTPHPPESKPQIQSEQPLTEAKVPQEPRTEPEEATQGVSEPFTTSPVQLTTWNFLNVTKNSQVNQIRHSPISPHRENILGRVNQSETYTKTHAEPTTQTYPGSLNKKHLTQTNVDPNTQMTLQPRPELTTLSQLASGRYTEGAGTFQTQSGRIARIQPELTTQTRSQAWTEMTTLGWPQTRAEMTTLGQSQTRREMTTRGQYVMSTKVLSAQTMPDLYKKSILTSEAHQPLPITGTQFSSTTESPTGLVTSIYFNVSQTEPFAGRPSKWKESTPTAQSKVEISTQAEWVRKSGKESPTQTESIARTDTESISTTYIGGRSKTQSAIQTEPDTKAYTESPTHNDLFTNGRKETFTKTEPDTQSVTTNTKSTKSHTLTESNTKSQTEPPTETKPVTKSKTEPHTQTEPITKTVTQTHTEAKPVTKAETEFPAQTELITKSEAKSATQTEPTANTVTEPSTQREPMTDHKTFFTTPGERVTTTETETDTQTALITANKTESVTQINVISPSNLKTEPTSQSRTSGQTEMTTKTLQKPMSTYHYESTRNAEQTQSDRSTMATVPSRPTETPDRSTPKNQATVTYPQTERTLLPNVSHGHFTSSITTMHRTEVSSPSLGGHHSPSQYGSMEPRTTPTWEEETSNPASQRPSETDSSSNLITTVENYKSESSGSMKSATSPLPTTSIPQTIGEMSARPGRERIFIVDEQQPVFKVQSISVTHTVYLSQPVGCKDPDPCKALFLQEVTSAYRSAPGFDRIESLVVALAGTALEYKVLLSVRPGSPMSAAQELALSNPTLVYGSAAPSENLRIYNASLAADQADPCTDWFSCPHGFKCVPVRKLSAICLSPCHNTYCHNNGICIHRKGQDAECQCPIGRDFWYMGQTCDYRMTHHRLAAIACGVVFCVIICAAAAVFILVRRFQTQILQQKVAQTQSSYRRFSRFDDVPTHFWCPSQTWLTASASLNSLDNPAFSSSEEVFPLQALGSCVCGCQDGTRNSAPTNPPQEPARAPPRLETSCSSVNDLMIDSGKASDVSVCSWPMEPIHWTPFPILHQLSLQSPFHARRPHSYFEGMELVNTERSWTA